MPGRLGNARVELVSAVVDMVRVAVPAVTPVMLTGLVDPKLKVGVYSAPAGLEVTEAVSVTLPVKPPAGVMVIVEVLPDTAPGETETAVPVIAKVGIAGAVPVPVRAAVCGEPVALSATDRVAEKLAAEAGVKVT
jgi:hypothetical protein